VAASGNRSGLFEYYPAALPGVIAVGSIDRHGMPSDFMTRGEHVSLCAPGEEIPCAGLAGYQQVSGTSFASPFVAAACALIIARAARYSMPVDAEMVRDFLCQSARPFPNEANAQGCGAGVLDVPAAIAAVDATLAVADEDAAPRRGVEGEDNDT